MPAHHDGFCIHPGAQGGEVTSEETERCEWFRERLADAM